MKQKEGKELILKQEKKHLSVIKRLKLRKSMQFGAAADIYMSKK